MQECKGIDQHIRGWNAQTLYALEYEHAGSRWAMNFYAVDDEDALAKLESLKQSLVLLGRSEVHELCNSRH